MFSVKFKRHGFTLIELVLTLVILGIVAAVSIPKFFNASTFEERFFHDDLLSAARYAQRLAVGSGCAVRMSVSGTGFSLDQDSNCDTSSPSYSLVVARPSDSESFSNVDVPANVSITAATSSYFFLPQGGVVDASNVSVGNSTIVLVGGLTRTINIIGATGYAYSN